ncbi:glutathione S-transferase theta-3-like [Conger conger]|uniref:glutathione S-transferase theta-3-like n=1 Tax=Conger conger TaxID=82655 RepID=UPI002A5A96D9|nr:glutathione S-transferase theta-3-like [Conger conger]
MALELYLDLFSQPCRSVFIFAKKNNIPFEFKKISLFEGGQHAEEFGKINMMRKVPAIRDGDFTLAESVAILLYMAEKFRTPDHWYPADLQTRARVNEYLSWQHTALRMHGSKVFWFKLLIPKALGKEVPKEKMDSALEDLEGSLKMLEEKFLQDRPFIAGEHISLADLVAIVDIMQPVGAGVDVFAERPKLVAWRDRVQAVVGKELFDEAHQSILSAVKVMESLDSSKLQGFKPRIMKLLL